MTTTGDNNATPATPTIVGNTRYASKTYEILIGYIKDKELPQYLVRNIETGVFEFNHEVLSFAREWITHFQGRLDALDAGKNPDEMHTTVAPRSVDFN